MRSAGFSPGVDRRGRARRVSKISAAGNLCQGRALSQEAVVSRGKAIKLGGMDYAPRIEIERPRHALARLQTGWRSLVWRLPALAVIAMAGGILGQFAVLLIVQWALQGAADMAAREAALPRATVQSVDAAARWQLAGWKFAQALTPPAIEVNDLGSALLVAPQPGDRVAVTLAVEASAAVPDWCGLFGVRLAPARLEARATSIVP